jgi:tRNA (adenine22-N1)-methyltransferase
VRPLCPRLAAIAELVPPGRPLADVACDHALLAAALVRSGRVPRAIACDRADGPLARARATTLRLGVTDRVVLRRGDGLAPLGPGEVDTAVIAGVGPATALAILAAAPALVRGLSRVVVQPNFGHAQVRRWLVDAGLAVVDERLVRDRGRDYTVLAAAPAAGQGPPAWSPAAWAFGPFVLRRGGPVLLAHLAAEARRCEAELAGLARAAAPRPAAAAALLARRALLAEALAEATALAHPGPA